MRGVKTYELEMVQLLNDGPSEGLDLGIILAQFPDEPKSILKILANLERVGIVLKRDLYGHRFYKICDNKMSPDLIRESVCFKCGSVRKVLGNDQIMAYCPNPNCLTPSGKRTLYKISRRRFTNEVNSFFSV